jgi:hypothetical protein
MSASELYAATIVTEKFWMHNDHIRNSIQSALRIAFIDGALSMRAELSPAQDQKISAGSGVRGLDL